VRRCRLRQDRGGLARGFPGRARRQAGGHALSDHGLGRAALPEFRQSIGRLPGAGGDALPVRYAQAAQDSPGGRGPGRGGYPYRHPPHPVRRCFHPQHRLAYPR